MAFGQEFDSPHLHHLETLTLNVRVFYFAKIYLNRNLYRSDNGVYYRFIGF